MAVNLTGIEVNGPALGAARKTSSSPGAAAGSQAGSQEGAAAEQGDVQITSTATLLARLEQSLAQQPAVDESRVTALSQAIASGRYQVSAGQVAMGLVSSERALARLPLAEI